MTTASLGFVVEFGTVEQATVALDRLTQSAKAAQAAASASGVSLTGGGVSMGGPTAANTSAMQANTTAANQNAAAQDRLALAHQRNGLAAVAAANQTRLSTQQMAQMQFQLQDVAVSLASGGSPFMVLMQQGSQMAQSFAAGTGPLAAARAVGAGIVAFLTNPLNLAVLAIASVAAAIPAIWAAFRGGAPDAEAALARHEDLLQRITEQYGEAAVKASEFHKASQEALAFDAARNAALQAELLKQSITDMLPTLRVMQESFTMDGVVRQGFEVIDLQIKALIEDAKDGALNVIEWDSAFTRLAQNSSPEVAELATRVHDLLAALAALNAQAEQADALSDLLRELRFTSPSFGLLSGLAVFGQVLNALRGVDLVTMSVAVQAAMAAAAESADKIAEAAEQRAGDRAAREAEAAARAAADEARAVRDLIDQLRFENSQLGLSNEQQAVNNALRQAGSAATDAQRQEIEGLTRAQVRYNESLKQYERDTAKAIGRMDDFRSGFENLLRAATRGPEALKDAVADMALDFGIGLISSSLFGEQGKPGGGLFGGIIQQLLGGTPDKPTMANTVIVYGNVVNVGGTGAAPGSFRAAQEEGLTPTASATGPTIPGAAPGGTGKWGPGWPGGVSIESYEPGTVPTLSQQEAYIRLRSPFWGIDPDIAVQMAKHEGLIPGVWQSNVGRGTPNRETSFGPFQLLRGGGLGDVFERNTGLNLEDQRTAFQQIDFALSQAARGGWGPWLNTMKKLGFSEWEGITRGGGLAGAATQATTLASQLDPLDWLDLFSRFGGLFQRGGHLGAGRWGIAGEAGPEIIHGPATVTPIAANGGGPLNVVNNFTDMTSRGVQIETRATRNAQGGAEFEYILTDFEREMVAKYDLRQPVMKWGRA